MPRPHRCHYNLALRLLASQPETLPAADLDDEEDFEGFDAPASRRTKAARNWRVPSALDD